MRTIYTCLLFALAMMCSSMTQCNKCIKGRLKINDDSKRWTPYWGKDSVAFITSANVLKKIRVSFTDTTKEAKNFNCDDTYQYDSIGLDLEADLQDSLIIHCIMGAPSWLCVHTMNRNGYFIGGCDVINGSESEMRKKFSNLRLNNVTYPEAILVNAYPGTNPVFDSLYFAKNFGVISFKYNNIHYYLKQ